MMDGLQAAGVRNFDFRSTANINVVDLEEWQVEKLSREIGNRGFRITAVSTPIGKISTEDDFEFDLGRLDRAIAAARIFKTKFIRVFSYYPPEGAQQTDVREEVLNRMLELTNRATAADMILLHENEKNIYGDNAQRCLDVLQTINSPHLRAVFDFANFVEVGEDPWTAWHSIKAFVRYFHIKDCLAETGEIVPAGYGDGMIEHILRDFKEGGGKAILSLEPHLQSAGQFQGYSGPELFQQAANALREVLMRVG
jgi:sugar phosphate isomerase/epimerase